MSNLIVQYLRRVGKFFTGKDDKPVVAQPGTNHIDDAAEWTEKTIYEGEQVANLYTGKLFTSDSRQIIELNREDVIIYGMQAVSIPGASAEADPLYIRVTDGYIRINGKTYKHKAVGPEDSAPGDITVQPNPGRLGRYDLIYASGDYPNKVDTGDVYYKAKLTVVKGSSNIQDLYNDDFVNTKVQGAGLEPDESILLGIVYVPPFYNALVGKNWLRPWSWGVSAADDNEKYLNFIQSQPKNIPSVTPGFLLDYIIGRIFVHTEPGGDLRKRYMYIKNQILTYDNGNPLYPDKRIYKVLSTHLCENLAQSINDDKIAPISGTGGGGSPGSGTLNHSELFELQYDYSGHVGFQRKTHVYDRDPGVNDSLVPPVGFVLAEAGNLWLNNLTEQSFICVDDTPGAAKWLTALGDVKDTEDDKDIPALTTSSDGDLAMTPGITHTPANDSYVKVELNGVGVKVGDGVTTDCDCYFSDDGGTTPKSIASIGQNDKLYWMGSYSGYELVAGEDKISLFYLINTTGTGSGSGFEGPLWGGDAVSP